MSKVLSDIGTILRKAAQEFFVSFTHPEPEPAEVFYALPATFRSAVTENDRFRKYLPSAEEVCLVEFGTYKFENVGDDVKPAIINLVMSKGVAEKFFVHPNTATDDDAEPVEISGAGSGGTYL